MNKAELCSVLADKAGLSKKQAEEFLDAFLETVIETLKSGGDIALTGFGTFSAKQRAARKGVNPQNPSQTIDIPATTVAKFKAGKRLKDSLKNA